MGRYPQTLSRQHWNHIQLQIRQNHGFDKHDHCLILGKKWNINHLYQVILRVHQKSAYFEIFDVFLNEIQSKLSPFIHESKSWISCWDSASNMPSILARDFFTSQCNTKYTHKTFHFLNLEWKPWVFLSSDIFETAKNTPGVVLPAVEIHISFKKVKWGHFWPSARKSSFQKFPQSNRQ